MILITGGMGFIGLHTARRFLDAGENVVITQYHARREPDFIKDEIGKRVVVEQLDVTNSLAVLDIVHRHKVTGIVHLAVPGLAALTPGEDYRVNMLGLLNVLEAARMFEVPRVTYASSVTVYASLPAGPYREDAPLPLASGNPTETFKKAWDVLAPHFAGRAGIETVGVRASTIWGPLYHTMMNLPSRVCHAAARGVPANFAGSRTGVPYADDLGDFCYVKDCALGIFLLQTANKKLPHSVYNIGAGIGRTNRDLVEAAKKVAPDLQVELQPGTNPRGKPNPYMDITQAKEDVGYAPQHDLEYWVADYIAWLRNNPE
ncbi:MAG TPA: NAD(P)-dependent oxidoreductase [Chloroflexota bacterium]|nr:NAD(P)-dependent oxidoreductase [Chloroflexota bacterium]